MKLMVKRRVSSSFNVFSLSYAMLDRGRQAHCVSPVTTQAYFKKLFVWNFKCIYITTFKGPHTLPRHPTTLSNHSLTTWLPLVWPVQQKSCIEYIASTWSQLHSSVYACAGYNKRVALKGAGWEVYLCNSLYFQSKRNLTISDKNSSILNMQRGITKRTQINTSWTDIITTSLMPVLPNMKTRNDRMECVENQSAHSIPPLSHTVLIR